MDNALSDATNGLYMADEIHCRSWRTRETVEQATWQWVSWSNHHRLHGPIGYFAPTEAEADYYKQLTNQVSTVDA